MAGIFQKKRTFYSIFFCLFMAIILLAYFTLGELRFEVTDLKTMAEMTKPVNLNGIQGVIFTKEYARYSQILFQQVAWNFWDPEMSDVRKGEAILNKCLQGSASVKEKFSQYKRQYAGVTTKQNVKALWINAFLDREDRFTDWTQKLVVIDGGGDDFFEAYVDLEKEECFDLYIHGQV